VPVRGVVFVEPLSQNTFLDPNGARMELLELPPTSEHARAAARWRWHRPVGCEADQVRRRVLFARVGQPNSDRVKERRHG